MQKLKLLLDFLQLMDWGLFLLQSLCLLLEGRTLSRKITRDPVVSSSTFIKYIDDALQKHYSRTTPFRYHLETFLDFVGPLSTRRVSASMCRLGNSNPHTESLTIA
jgi:hypothetical protein